MAVEKLNAANPGSRSPHDIDWQADSRCCAQWPLWGQLRLLLMLGLLGLSGCGGCLPTQQEKLTREEVEKRKREQRDAIEYSDLVSLPTDSETKFLTVKPGHWHETQQQFKSTREDLQVVAVESITRGTRAALVPGTNTIHETTRRTSLPKGQTKTVDLQSFVPASGVQAEVDGFPSASNKLNFRTDLLSWPLMTPLLPSPIPYPTIELKPHEFELFVMSPQALSYEYLTVLDAVYWRQDEMLMQDAQTRSYRVALVKPKDNRYAVPRSLLTMTAVAVIVWDDVSVDDLSLDQKSALIDWLHWGGQLLVSGPSSWSRLQNSFLSPYLPAGSAESAEFRTSDFAAMSSHWSVEDLSARSSPEPLEIVGAPVGGLRFKLNERGSWLPGAGEMVAESQVGRGRIVVTAFPMREPRIYRWKYYGSFFSTGLLRRHPRSIQRTTEERLLQQVWNKPFQNATLDPRLHSNVRILARDLPLATDDREMPREDARWGSGGAAWNDYSGLSHQAVIALRSAAGIELPSRTTIVYLLGGYLLCLVPLNWLFFRAFRRLEFAWIAAPIMALIGVAVVTKVASLDIGFARRTTEISLLELHGGHQRGHLSKFLALYTSLSTNYAVDFPEHDSLALPLGDFGSTQFRPAAGTHVVRTSYGRSQGVRLEPVIVYSNSTEMLHAEQIIPLPGAVSLGVSSNAKEALRNETGLQLHAALVIRCLPTGVVERAWIGDLPSGQVAAVSFRAVEGDNWASEWSSELATQPNMPPQDDDSLVDSLWVGGMLKEVLQKTPLMPGQARLIGYTDDRVGELQISPVEDQYDGRCVVVAHLAPRQLGETVPDTNILSRAATEQGAPEISGETTDETTETGGL